ncbi:Na+/H+ antiporter NhaA [Endozoicomonas sp. OPT23]|uniref:Na+/H+ antiporter NhaA n=1 Tax=Endozoicomonas sp. OPT23 TaxID=2072845 RepID=UPI00129A19F8|nr:Na+/H+ antiporter NhaA [Endozoicomonas sp. OPT23]MRI32202.1 Na+/H+ antiporter NhaA [Endozoicomonas sp. OPT23]
MLFGKIRHFLHQEYAVGILLIIAATLAMLAANSPLSSTYDLFLNLPIQIAIGPLEIGKPLLLWVNDGLMALFFLLIGLEVKHEVVEGELSSPSQIALPAIAAVGGMLIPALVYTAFNYTDAAASQGWAIPAATDIAFAVGVLALLGKRVPPSLKIFLLALAIIDDLGAIIIIALFFTSDLSVMSITLAAAFICVLVLLNRLKVTSLTPYLFFGTLLWICVLKSGVHATLAGVIIALTIPIKLKDKKGRSPLKRLEHKLHENVNYFILPMFAFANAGLALSINQLATLTDPVPFGIIAGLLIGKPLGVFGFTWLAIVMGLAKKPAGSTWMQLFGLSILCGIGFTMSLFIGSLAFETVGQDLLLPSRIGVLVGSLFSAILGYLVLRFAGRNAEATT